VREKRWVSAFLCLSLPCTAFAQTSQTRRETSPAVSSPASSTQAATNVNTSELLKQLDRLVEQNEKLQEQNKALIEEIKVLRKSLAGQVQPSQADSAASQQSQANAPQTPASSDEAQVVEQKPASVPGEIKQTKWGAYTPNFGYKVASTEHGDLSISIYTYARYLNQKLLAPSTTNGFGQPVLVNQRQDAELNKLQMKFLGWVIDPKLRYFLYAWTNNAAQGSSFYIALAGWTGYQFTKSFGLYGGVNGIPGTRSIEGNFPFWLGVDSRHIADEFFRPSYSQGFFAKGDIGRFRYTAMVANNLSTLGVQASQFPGRFNTYSTALVWMPSTGEFGPGFGDFEEHDKVATRLGLHFTHSDENKQSQPNTDAFENTQIRLTDGSIIFTPNLFGPGVTVNDVRYRMSSFDGGIKYRGNALEAEYFLRWLDDFRGPGTAVIPNQFDHGFQVQGSTMLVPKTLQLYIGGSKIFGDFGKPWDTRIGTNYFPFKNRVFRWNSEFLYLSKSPVGYTAVPFAVGGKGWVYHTNFELAF
jgi:hypothetical protein